MYQVKVTMGYPTFKKKVKWTGIFIPKGKNKTAKIKTIKEQCVNFCREHIGLEAGLDKNKLNIEVTSVRMKINFCITEDEII